MSPNAYSCPAMPHVDLGPQLESCFNACIETQRAAIKEFKPTLVVASSFGAAVCIQLILEGTWTGPTLLLACAHKLIGKMIEKEGGRTFEMPRLPAGAPILILHGRQDVVVPIEDSRELYTNAVDKERVKMVEVDDTHGLRKQVQEDLLKDYVNELWNSAGGKGAAMYAEKM